MAKAYLSIGSNLDRERNIALAIARLKERYGDLELSSIYESDAVGFDGDTFYNLAVGVESEESPAQMIRYFRAIEGESGRNRESVRYGPRTLDIDLLLYGNRVCAENGLELPRPELTRYAFVLRPLAEIAGNVGHPTAGKSIGELWSAFDDSDQTTRRLQGEKLRCILAAGVDAGRSSDVFGSDLK